MKQANTLTKITGLLLAGVLFHAQIHAKEAEIYRGRAADGSVIFSDQPLPDTESIQIEAPQTIPALESAPEEASSEEKPKTEAARGYEQLNIVSPTDDETLRANSGAVTVSYVSTPPLNVNKGHYLRVLLDGKPLQVPPGTMSVTLDNLDRGRHELAAEIMTYEGTSLIQSPKTTFNLKRFSVLFKKTTNSSIRP